MEDARSYMTSTAPAAEGMFKLLNQYGWQKMRAFVGITNSKTREEIERHKEAFSGTDIAREVVAGSILQIAYFGIERYAVPADKSQGALRFESEMNRLIRENPSTRWKKQRPFELPNGFCVGRDIGLLPLGILVLAGRNQYNHYSDTRLSVLNEVVFNQLHNMWPAPKHGVSFDLYEKKRPRAFSILAALGWTDSRKEMGYSAYKRDMSEVLQVEL